MRPEGRVECSSIPSEGVITNLISCGVHAIALSLVQYLDSALQLELLCQHRQVFGQFINLQ